MRMMSVQAEGAGVSRRVHSGNDVFLHAVIGVYKMVFLPNSSYEL
jgi:hypothetical protein